MFGRWGKQNLGTSISCLILSGLDQPVLKWSLPDNSHVCLVTDNTINRGHFSRDIAVSNLTAMG